jgi:hypothetical protein
MRLTTTTMARLAAVLATAALVAPAGATPGPGADWYAGKSTIEGSIRTDESRGRQPEGGPVDQRRLDVAHAQERYYASFRDQRPLPPPRATEPDVTAVDAFDWGDAVVAAAGTFGVLLVSLGGAMIVRQRHPRTRSRVAAG